MNRPGAVISDENHAIAILEHDYGFKHVVGVLEQKAKECLNTAYAAGAAGKDPAPALMLSFGFKRSIEVMRECILNAKKKLEQEKFNG